MSRLRGVLAGAAAATATYSALRRRPWPGARHNYRDRRVTLAAGPAAAAGALAGAAGAMPAADSRDRRLLGACALAVGSAALAGGYDDAAGSPATRGLSGHLGALAAGEVSTGAVKVLAIGAGAVAAADRLGGPPAETLLSAVLIGGSANLVNLFDLRPGRATKLSLLLAAGLLPARKGWLASGVAGAGAALLPADLREQSMLGDLGANALGAALGTTLAVTLGLRARAALAVAILGLTALSERVSFSQVIDAHPGLRWLDRLGRSP